MISIIDIPCNSIEIDKVLSVLSAESKGIELANELDKANQEGNWYWMIKHLRNYSLHGSLLSADASLDVIPYFEQTLVQLRNHKIYQNQRTDIAMKGKG